ncbi:hypothetical protein [Serratia marcescens]|uniref:hypothetical protein n=1 Tax=Serratia marcescens TaxID=615 RepID=UPI0027E4B7CB|nr:hypothetical protein [Serratia marcescens]WLS18582.1 hypothetical protein RAA91_20920 [Serratia marcescens]HCB1445110.1 hypothetical protein [Serratia marcescens]HCB1484262.1 hypothetical protein [Serratia marcescens]HCB1614407.1 hypothetical protein [Serratia marcescens]HCB1619652.1 hypothetical protein [Serratia marcescens]
MAKKLDALSRWFNHQSWTSGHHLDETRFYRAVYQVLKENDKGSITPDDIRNYVISQFTGKLDPTFLSERAEQAAERFEIISEFCEANNI